MRIINTNLKKLKLLHNTVIIPLNNDIISLQQYKYLFKPDYRIYYYNYGNPDNLYLNPQRELYTLDEVSDSITIHANKLLLNEAVLNNFGKSVTITFDDNNQDNKMILPQGYLIICKAREELINEAPNNNDKPKHADSKNYIITAMSSSGVLYIYSAEYMSLLAQYKEDATRLYGENYKFSLLLPNIRFIYYDNIITNNKPQLITGTNIKTSIGTEYTTESPAMNRILYNYEQVFTDIKYSTSFGKFEETTNYYYTYTIDNNLADTLSDVKISIF